VTHLFEQVSDSLLILVRVCGLYRDSFIFAAQITSNLDLFFF
jgi:hypothetical protein